MAEFALQARYVLPMAGPPLAGGVVTVGNGRIEAVGNERPEGVPLVDLGGAVLLPGLVNAHTHLEFSLCREPLARPGVSLPAWIDELLSLRTERHGSQLEAIAQGMQESLACGVTTVGEIATAADSLELSPRQHPYCVRFYEILGLSDERVATAEQDARFVLQSSLERRENESPQAVLPALSPHAPYSTHPRLVRWACQQSAQHRFPLAMHLAESREELQLLATGDGPFADFLKQRAVWNPTVFCSGTKPLDYLQMLSAAAGALVVHGNYLEPDELDFLAAHRERMSLVYCPRTHTYFQHEPYPLREALQRGVRVVLGTDSRASNPDLNLLAEMRHVAELFPGLARETILRMGTSDAAEALGLADRLGQLAPGKIANLAAIELPQTTGSAAKEALYEAVLHQSAKVVGTWVEGEQVFSHLPS